MGTIFFSAVYAYHPQHFADAKPETIEDFFDLERFPGRRGMRRVPGDNLTRALHHDWQWWSDHGDEMNERFSAWLAR